MSTTTLKLASLGTLRLEIVIDALVKSIFYIYNALFCVTCPSSCNRGGAANGVTFRVVCK